MSIDALSTALQRILLSIPKEILEATFNPHLRRISLDQCIVLDVIQTRIVNDLNIRGGKIIDIPLDINDAIPVEQPVTHIGPTGIYSVYVVPPYKRENKPLVAVMGLRHPYGSPGVGTCGTGACSGGMGVTMAQLSDAVLESHTFANTITTPTPILLNGDTIKLEPPQMNHFGWILSARVSYDAAFTNMDINTISTFADLVLCAVKFHIYISLVIKMGSMYLHSGSPLGVFKDKVEEYRDQEDKYNELLLTFQGAATLDPQRLNRILAWL